MESFPLAKRGVAMAVFTMGIVVAPILGPIIGGLANLQLLLALGLLN